MHGLFASFSSFQKIDPEQASCGICHVYLCMSVRIDGKDPAVVTERDTDATLASCTVSSMEA